MTIAELIAVVDEVRPNQLSKQLKTMWLSEIEHRVFEEVVSRAIDFCPNFVFKPYVYDLNDETELMIPDVYGDVYRSYIYSKIDYALGEIDRYNNDAALFQAAWDDFAGWYRRNHYPKERRYYGAVALFESESEPEYACAITVHGAEPTACGKYWGICGPAKCIEPVLPCHCCEKAQRNYDNSTNEP
jgi:hypothetical protein